MASAAALRTGARYPNRDANPQLTGCAGLSPPYGVRTRRGGEPRRTASPGRPRPVRWARGRAAAVDDAVLQSERAQTRHLRGERLLVEVVPGAIRSVVDDSRHLALRRAGGHVGERDADLLLGLGERAVGDHQVAVADPHGGGRGRGSQWLAAQQHAAGAHLFGERGERREPHRSLLGADHGGLIVADQQCVSHGASFANRSASQTNGERPMDTKTTTEYGRAPWRSPRSPGCTRPASYATITAWTLSRSPSLSRMCPMYVFTVLSPRNSVPAISAFERPRAINLKTWVSRSVSRSSLCPEAFAGRRRVANSSTSRRVMLGASSASPRR